MRGPNGQTHLPKRTQSTLTGEAPFTAKTPIREETQTPTATRREGELRIFYQNVNGIKPNSREWEDMITEMSRRGVGVFGLSETNFNWTPTAVSTCRNRAMRALYQEKGKRSNITIQASLCAGWEGGQYQPGGTCTGAMGNWESRVNSKSGDPENMGRWSTLRIQIKGTVLSVITVYRVCKTPVTLESNTAYSQQWREWKTKTDKKVDPRERTLHDLKKCVKGEIEKKREVVVLMDANEAINSRTDEMNELIYECGLVDTHLIKDPYEEVETYARGKEKIDFVLVAPSVQQCITYSHIAP